MQSNDAYINRSDNTWVIGSASVERAIALKDGKFILQRYMNKSAGLEMLPKNATDGEFSVALEDGGERVSGDDGGWKLIGSKETKLKQGELQLDITLQRGSLQVTKSYVVYPQSSVIREWVAYKNAGTEPLKIIEPSFLTLTAKTGALDSYDLRWMTGGENQPDSWLLQTEKLDNAKPRVFDSYTPFLEGKGNAPGDGVNVKILQNDRQIWPESGWGYLKDSNDTKKYDVSVDVKAGDKLVFLVNMNQNFGWDTTAFDPTLAYDDGEIHTASKEFSGKQGENGWQYQYIEDGKFIDLAYYPKHKQWRKAKDNDTGTPFVSPDSQHPDSGQDVVRVWTAPKDGHIHITGSVCNTGNGMGGGYGSRMGSSSYAPWVSLYSNDSKNGLFIGWDFLGHWVSSYKADGNGTVSVSYVVAGHKQVLKPGESVTTPKAFTGLYSDDLDNAGNELLDWQYRYLWDYTRDGWFPAIRMLGYWMKGTGWGKPGVSWTGGDPDWDSTFRKVFRVADLMRYCGADVYHRDWGWWDRAGDWNGPDFRTTGEYLHKSDMGQLIYAFLYTVAQDAKVVKEHPDWAKGGCLDMGMPEVVEFMKGQLDSFAERWGNFEWRNDSSPTNPYDGDDTHLLAQDQGFRKVLTDFLDKHTQCAFQAVNGGGNGAGYDYTRYASSLSFSDGAVGVLRNYYASLLFPPDKTSDIPDLWNPDKYEKSAWRGLLCINFDMTGDTWDPAKLEGIRELIDIYHYLHKQGVVGRWVNVYRPVITGDEPSMYFQRLSGDHKRGIIITKHTAPGPVTIKPKGLISNETYFVSYQESDANAELTGKELMERGLSFDKLPAGELIYLNMPLHPGSKLDKEPPTAPSGVTKKSAENMGYPGIEIKWQPAADNNWVSYYEIFRDGATIDKVAKGTYYFDHSAGADIAATYEVRTVDGAGNTSGKAIALGQTANPSLVYNDMNKEITYTGNWNNEKDLLPAYKGTITSSKEKGAALELTFKGRKVLWFSKYGANCGKAAVSIDNGPAEIVDTYSADDIWGVCLYRKELPNSGTHKLKIEVLGEHGDLAKDSLVYVDGIRIEE
ncbi:hypothetical protein LLG39_08675 [bacterium]|nr:hypothetical protein [bacterium]